MSKFKIVGFAGSLRAASYNKAILRAAATLLPQNAELEIIDLEGMPLFNEDIESDLPQSIKDFKAKIKAADALLIATPEYNYSMPGVLKNALDWGSRPYGDNSFDGKPVGIVGASIGVFGTARAQYHLRQSCVFLNMHPLNKPEVMIGVAYEKFDATGLLVDDKTKELIKTLLVNLEAWSIKLK